MSRDVGTGALSRASRETERNGEGAGAPEAPPARRGPVRAAAPAREAGMDDPDPDMDVWCGRGRVERPRTTVGKASPATVTADTSCANPTVEAGDTSGGTRTARHGPHEACLTGTERDPDLAGRATDA